MRFNGRNALYFAQKIATMRALKNQPDGCRDCRPNG
jgi:hypothetical protein